MAIKLKIPSSRTTSQRGRGRGASRLANDPLLRFALLGFLCVSMLVVGVFVYWYVKYDRIIEQRFRSPVFAASAKIFAAPQVVRVGSKATVTKIAAELRHAGYTEKAGESPLGSYHLKTGSIEVQPGPASYHSPEPATITVADGAVTNINSRVSGDLAAYELEPQMLTSLFDAEQRSKRQLVKYEEIPKVMVDAVTSIEDRRFFQHNGVNFLRLAEAAWIDFTHQRHQQGGSTITMQLSRAFFLSPEKTLKRKMIEMLIAVELEQKFSKQQIFEFYANRVDLGQRGSFTISGLAEGSRSYFNKDLKDVTLPEAALLAGLIQAPSYLSPYRHPERALERRNTVIEAMVDTHDITREQADKAKATPLKLAPPNVEASDAPYFVDMVRDTIVGKLNEHELNEQEYRIYTTLDPDLQSAAAQAVETGIKLVDDQVTKMRTHKKKIGKNKFETTVTPGPQAQVALVAMDPHTGEIKALVGGRNYGMSQLNHALAKRPTGSIFKPFVYAAALNTALDGSTNVITPASTVTDQPSTFTYGDQIYEPRNYKEEYHGDVTLRYALALSLNNATVKVAEEVGYDKVADLAKSAGIASVKATPAMALGAYDATPVDMTAAYTTFANGGLRLSPVFVNSVRNSSGDIIMNFGTTKAQVLDPRVAFVMTNMLEGVLNFGTAYGVRSRGFTAPAAGKTGTSHDGWFAGYTSNLLCIVWVGYDDYSDIRLSGAQTAAPIWAEFMKKAVALPQYDDLKPFTQPQGVIDVQLDKITNRLATPACPDDYTIAFVAGTEPHDTCDQSSGVKGFFSRVFGGNSEKALPPPGTAGNPTTTSGVQPSTEDETQKKKSLFGKIVGVFRGDSSSPDKDKDKDKSEKPGPAPSKGSDSGLPPQ
ncbi:MAG TPA: PBP1A family penicillin-binding protein [Terriglobales bacterium]|jgi:penicillin-binding protein 1B|nr:PBP1A family penicillin-binding protein [Terriglobales bacterium]